MRKILLLLIIGILGCGGRMDQVKSPSSGVQHLADSTVALMMRDKDGDWRVFCTGVWVGDGEIATAHHCVQAVANILASKGADEEAKSEKVDVDVLGVKIHYIVQSEVEGIEEEPSGVHLAKVVMDDSHHDVSLLKAVGGNVPKHDLAVLASRMPGVGDKIEVIGHVKGMYWTYVEGNVSAYRDGLPERYIDITGPFMQYAAPVYFGNSGGGVFNKDGELVGIVSFMASAPMTNFAIPVKRIRTMMKEQREVELKHEHSKKD